MDTILTLGSGRAARRVRLGDYLDPEREERAALDALAWIKRVRLAQVDGTSFRERFTYRGDSLWWFAELYLHKERAILSIFRIVAAATTLFERERPQAIQLERGGRVAALLLPQIAAARGAASSSSPRRAPAGTQLWRLDARSTALMIAAVASPSRRRARPTRPATVAAFVHRAFWRGAAAVEDGGAESYIGPVLQALERALPRDAVHHVGIGPATNFRARSWWRRPQPQAGITAIESLTSRDALAGSSGLWAARHAMRRAMHASPDLRDAARISGCDCWPIVEEALTGVALLQFPWSARAMDEAAAALECLQPEVAVTYAEAGGWGRALALEARRRSIPLAGIQHGFIYRHWLNYLHEPDEMAPPSPDFTDRGFPYPSRTLVFNRQAERHLTDAGHLPPEAVMVTGSPRLDQLAARYSQLTEREVAEARQAAGASDARPLVLLASKFSEVRGPLPALLAAVRALPQLQLAIKTHPAETSAPYELAAAGIANVRVLPASADLATLLRACRAVVTVNSTVALDGLALGVPALTIGVPNNLSPFAEAGAMAGAAASAEAIGAALERLLYDEGLRAALAAGAAALVSGDGMSADGGAAERAAAAVLALVRRRHHHE